MKTKHELLGELFSRAGSLSEDKLEELLKSADGINKDDKSIPKSVKVANGIILLKNARSPYWWASISSAVTGVNKSYRESTGIPLSNIEEAKAKAHLIAAKAKTLADTGQLAYQQAHSMFRICNEVIGNIRSLADKNNEAKSSTKREHATKLEEFFYPFCKESGVTDIHKVNTSFLFMYLRHLAHIGQLGSQTRYRVHTKAVRKVLEYALEKDYIKRRDMPEIPTVSQLGLDFNKKAEDKKDKENVPFEHEDFINILNNFYRWRDGGARSKETTIYYRSILPLYFEFLIAQGCRTGKETLGVRFEDIARHHDEPGKPPIITVTFRKGKMGARGKSRTVELKGDALNVVLRICRFRFGETFTIDDLRNQRGFIFYDEHEQKEPPIDRTWSQYMDWLHTNKLIRKKYNLYSCRHEFINKMLDTNEMTVYEIAAHCGNSVQTIETYYQKFCVVRKSRRKGKK
ncbi:hypothetical protein P3547_19995 [Vibrio parahaemolyticus]|nr:hypothetical protein [Vibrio parahaemolyticus]